MSQRMRHTTPWMPCYACLACSIHGHFHFSYSMFCLHFSCTPACMHFFAACSFHLLSSWFNNIHVAWHSLPPHPTYYPSCSLFSFSSLAMKSLLHAPLLASLPLSWSFCRQTGQTTCHGFAHPGMPCHQPYSPSSGMFVSRFFFFQAHTHFCTPHTHHAFYTHHGIFFPSFPLLPSGLLLSPTVQHLGLFFLPGMLLL